MGQQRRIKQLRRELKHMRRKNQQEESLYFADKYDVLSVEKPILEEQNAVLDQINEEHEEIGEILKRLMPVLPSFSEQLDETTTRKIVAKEEAKDKDESTPDDNGKNAATIKIEAVEQEEENSNEVSTKFEEELQFLKEWLETPCFDGACTKIAVTDNRNEESINDEDDIEWEATLDTYKEVHGILMHWSPEEIRFYFELMLQHSIEHGIDDCGQAWRPTINENFEEFIDIERKSRTVKMQPSSRTKEKKMKIKVENKTSHEVFKIWSRKRKKTNKYYLSTKKVKIKLSCHLLFVSLAET